MRDCYTRKPGRAASVLAVLAGLALALCLTGDAFARDRNSIPRKNAKVAQNGQAAKWQTRRQHQPRVAAGTNSALGDVAAVAQPGLGGGAHAALTPQQYEKRRADPRAAIVAGRGRLPHRPFPGERGFTGVPPAGETRFVSNEIVFHVPPNVSRRTVDDAARKLGLSTIASHNMALTGGTIFHFRVAQGHAVADAVRALEIEKIGIAQPNYVYTLQQSGISVAPAKASDFSQYVVTKLQLAKVHQTATGSNVLIAVIDSEIDSSHPDLAGALVERFDAVGHPDRPHAHGTGMTGAIVAHRRLMGVAPAAKVLAVHAFSPDATESAQTTTGHVIAGLEWAINKGARVVNMSFAGPYDPLLQLAMKNAHDRGVVLIAAAGNLGRQSPPLYPAADPNVIAVTAVDQNDTLLASASRGPHIALAAPGVKIVEPAPNAAYQLTSGTSVAAAHVSGIAALMIERNPALTPDSVHEILTASAKPLTANGRDDQFGWGLADPVRALMEVDAQVAHERRHDADKSAAVQPAARKTSW